MQGAHSVWQVVSARHRGLFVSASCMAPSASAPPVTLAERVPCPPKALHLSRPVRLTWAWSVRQTGSHEDLEM